MVGVIRSEYLTVLLLQRNVSEDRMAPPDGL